MPPLPLPREPGRLLTVKGRQVGFSFWPARPGRQGRHYALQSLLFALDPWIVIRRAVETECPAASRSEALATLEQARDFFVAGTEGNIVAARPLVLYYSYMNLVKAYCLTQGVRTTFDRARHGLGERLGGQNREYLDAWLQVDQSPAAPAIAQNFDEFKGALTGTKLAAATRYDLPMLMPQVLSGHRHWAQAAHVQERFIAFDSIEFWHDPDSHQMWLRMYLFADDLSRLSITHRRFLNESRLGTLFREVRIDQPDGARHRMCLEQIAPLPYVNYPLDELNRLSALVKSLLWVTVSTVQPYRRYYAYLCPPAEQGSLVEQLLSVYAITFYLGSITRYRPHHYDALFASRWGPRVQDFVTGQPAQFLYLMASEFSGQDVTRPSIL